MRTGSTLPGAHQHSVLLPPRPAQEALRGWGKWYMIADHVWQLLRKTPTYADDTSSRMRRIAGYYSWYFSEVWPELEMSVVHRHIKRTLDACLERTCLAILNHDPALPNQEFTLEHAIGSYAQAACELCQMHPNTDMNYITMYLHTAPYPDAEDQRAEYEALHTDTGTREHKDPTGGSAKPPAR